MKASKLARLQDASCHRNFKVRPWSRVRSKQARASALRLRKMLGALPDERVAEVTGLSLKAIKFLRELRY
jgi:hypothetical protein